MPNNDQAGNIVPCVLILYQGDKATPFRKHIVERLEIAGCKPSALRYNEYDHNDGVALYERLEEAVEKCDAAVALVTLDEREASSCGNLWMEIGYWLGRKHRKTIKIMLQSQPSDWAKDIKWPVEPPSNIVGQHCPRFSDDKDLSTLITEYSNEVKDMLRKPQIGDTHTKDGIYIDRHKISEILLSDKAGINPEDLYECPIRNKKCNYRKESISLLCEFLHMEEVSWLDWLASVFFNRLCHLCLKTVNTDYEGVINNPYYRRNSRCTSIDEIHNMVKSILGAISYAKYPAGKPHNAKNKWEKLKDYLMYRLNLDYYRKWGIPDEVTKESHKKDIESFCEWAKWWERGDYRQSDYYKNGFRPTGRSETIEEQEAEQFLDNGRFASRISKALNLHHATFRGEYTSAFSKSKMKLTNNTRIAQAIQVMCKHLPQNRIDSQFPRIWPISINDKDYHKVSAGI
ncbi:hypothetical protein ACFL6U_16255 [Planctomycetota bacterium]